MGLRTLSPNPIGVITTLFKNGLTENHGPIFGFDELIPKPYRRDQPAQRLWDNHFEKMFEWKPQERFGTYLGVEAFSALMTICRPSCMSSSARSCFFASAKIR
ncbi:MAG: hypothetical protein RBR63_09565, partial [Methanosarcina vacuolata]|nr:hypothetical protein [Methanosarcina vacuolata]